MSTYRKSIKDIDIKKELEETDPKKPCGLFLTGHCPGIKNEIFELDHKLELCKEFLTCQSKACKTLENILSCVENIPKEFSSAQENGENVLLFTLI